MGPSETRGQLHADAKRVFSEALEQPAEQRARYVEQICGAGTELYREVISLLEHYDPTGSFLERPALGGIPVPASDPMLGRRLGVYRILRQIGMGGMGAVYLAERADDQFRKRVALKAVRPGLIDEQVLRRFQNERQMLAVLDHPAIIKLLDAGTTEEGVPYLVTEYVEGQPIDVYCASRKLSVRERITIFRIVLGAVHFAHQNLVVHRDLKPGNILVTADGAPKLLDFGIAKLLRAEFSAHMGLTRTELQPMTPEFASPEQVLGQPINTASDIYSLGVILYRLLTGRHPFELKTGTPVELERAICETEPERPSRFVAHAQTPARADASLLRGDLDNIVLMAMRKEPQRRYASAEHFSEDLRRHLEGFPVLARKAGPWYRVSKFAGRHKAACVAAALTTIALAFSGVTALEEKRAAERRFQDLRQFANFMLNEMDREMRKGLVPAREALANKSLEYLDGLSREKSDASIQREVVNGYIKVGDAQGNLYVSSGGKIDAAEASYRRAVNSAEQLAKSAPNDPENLRCVVAANLKLGEALNSRGNRAEAMKHFDEALRVNGSVLSAGPSDLETLIFWFRAWMDVASAHALTFDSEGARESHRRALEIAQRFPESFANRRFAIVSEKEQVAYWGALAGDIAGAEEAVRDSIAALQQEISLNAKLPWRRSLAKDFKDLADLQNRGGKRSDALASIRRSIDDSEQLVAVDPKSESYQIDLQQALMKEIEILTAAGLAADARSETKRALDLMKRLAGQPDAPFQPSIDCAEILVTTPFAEFRDDAAALRYARAALAKTQESDPGVWHVLALACERNGDRQQAIEANHRALSLLPPERPGRAKSEFRSALEADLVRLSRPAQQGSQH